MHPFFSYMFRMPYEGSSDPFSSMMQEAFGPIFKAKMEEVVNSDAFKEAFKKNTETQLIKQLMYEFEGSAAYRKMRDDLVAAVIKQHAESFATEVREAVVTEVFNMLQAPESVNSRKESARRQLHGMQYNKDTVVQLFEKYVPAEDAQRYLLKMFPPAKKRVKKGA